MDIDRPFARLDLADAVVAVAVAALVAALHLDAATVEHDPAIYLEMARNLLGPPVDAPFRFRIATPALAAAWPGSVPVGFMVVTWAGVVATTMVVRRTAVALSGDVRRGTAAAALFLTSGSVVGLMYLPYLSDPLSMAAGASALELGRRRRWLLAGLALAVGTASRETTLFVGVPLAVWCLRSTPSTRGRFGALMALGGPGAAVYLALHRSPLLYGEVLSGRVQSPVDIITWNASQGGLVTFSLVTLACSLGMMWFALPWVVRRTGPHSASSTSLLLLVPLLLGSLVASDWPRILGYAAIAVAPAVAVAAPRRLLAPLVVASTAVTVVALPFGDPVAAGALSVVVGLAGWVLWLRSDAREVEGALPA